MPPSFNRLPPPCHQDASTLTKLYEEKKKAVRRRPAPPRNRALRHPHPRGWPCASQAVKLYGDQKKAALELWVQYGDKLLKRANLPNSTAAGALFKSRERSKE